jgi:hydrogenase nickel incorporation protein HypA/HybF
MGITHEVLDAVLVAAAKAGAKQVNVVRITVGELTEVVPDALQFAWEVLRRDTIAENAVLEVREVGGRSRCLECDMLFDHGRYDRRCPSCGGFMCSVVEGNELRIDDVDVD